MTFLVKFIFFSLCCLCATIHAKDSEKGIEFFENKIRPVLAEHCYECHSAKSEKLKGGLLLDRSEGWKRGGKSGAVIKPGKPLESILYSALGYENDDLQMPPSGKLSNGIRKDFMEWIAMGAPDPRKSPVSEISAVGGLKAKSLEDGRKFWSFKPVKVLELPQPKNLEWVVDDIDRFILDKLEKKDLSPALKADPVTLVRRIFFDLTGLPPSPKQVKDFQNDLSPNAWEHLVESLLNSPRFGERWGRHWLDVARYADTTGGGRNNPFPNAHRYRDYVIESFNKDKPFNLFIKEQIAGDLMQSSSETEINEKLTGTGFLALGPHNYELQDKELLRMEVVDEQLSAVAKAFMGLTMDCARCHDHPFDPIPIQDYYSMAGIFRSTNSLVPGNVARFHERDLRDAFVTQRNEHQKTLGLLEKKLKEAISKVKSLGGDTKSEKSIDPLILEGIVIDNTEAKVTGEWISSTHTSGYVGKGYLHDNNSEKGNKSITYRAIISEGGQFDVQVSYPFGPNRSKNTPVTVMHADGEQKVFIDQTKPPKILNTFVSLGIFRFEKSERDAVQITTEGTSNYVIADAVRLLRVEDTKENTISSESKNAGKKIVSKSVIEEAEREVERCKEAIEKHKRNAPPKVQKVMSVREQEKTGDWHIHLRGEIRNLGPIVKRGFLKVATPPNESSSARIPDGTSGRLQLAEWIASPNNPLPARVYANRVWHHLFGRGIVKSTDNFGEMGDRPSHPKLLDYLADYLRKNQWSTKSLLRKIVLSNTYQMSTFGSQLSLEKDPENQLFSRQNRRRLQAEAIRDAMLVSSGQISFHNPSLEKNRSLFHKINRNKLPELFEVFDYPNPGLVSGNRNTSSVPTQALFMMNNEFVMKQAQLTTELITKKQGLDLKEKIRLIFLTCLNREPRREEMDASIRFLEESKEKKSEDFRLDGLVHSLFACLDFRYLN